MHNFILAFRNQLAEANWQLGEVQKYLKTFNSPSINLDTQTTMTKYPHTPQKEDIIGSRETSVQLSASCREDLECQVCVTNALINTETLKIKY